MRSALLVHLNGVGFSFHASRNSSIAVFSCSTLLCEPRYPRPWRRSWQPRCRCGLGRTTSRCGTGSEALRHHSTALVAQQRFALVIGKLNSNTRATRARRISQTPAPIATKGPAPPRHCRRGGVLAPGNLVVRKPLGARHNDVARAQPRVVIFTQQEQLGALLVGQSHWQWGRSRHRQQPLKNKSDAIEYIIITTYTYMPYFCHIPLVSRSRSLYD